jgi:hypothetical protein
MMPEGERMPADSQLLLSRALGNISVLMIYSSLELTPQALVIGLPLLLCTAEDRAQYLAALATRGSLVLGRSLSAL